MGTRGPESVLAGGPRWGGCTCLPSLPSHLPASAVIEGVLRSCCAPCEGLRWARDDHVSKSHGILLGLLRPEGTVPAGELAVMGLGDLTGLAHIEEHESWGALTCGWP